jgi:hypothetical protein
MEITAKKLESNNPTMKVQGDLVGFILFMIGYAIMTS